MAIVDKRRQEANQCEVMNVIGDVKGKDCILFDYIDVYKRQEQIRKWETQFHSELIKLSDNPQLERLYEFNLSLIHICCGSGRKYPYAPRR